MSLVRLLINELPPIGGAVVLPEAQGHHLVRVRRKAQGDAVILQTPKGMRALGEVTSAEGDLVTVLVKENLPPIPGVLAVKLFPALLPDAAFSLLLQKSTEIGVREITPVLTEYTVAKVGDLEKKMRRWQTVCDEAACQCGGVPAVVKPPLKFQEALKEKAALRLLADASGKALSEFPAEVSEVALLIGPEGGHSAAEMEEAEKCGWQKASFHPFILRAETAAVVCSVLCQARWGGLA